MKYIEQIYGAVLQINWIYIHCFLISGWTLTLRVLDLSGQSYLLQGNLQISMRQYLFMTALTMKYLNQWLHWENKNNCKRTPKRQTRMDNPGIQYDRNQFKKIFFLNQLYYNQWLTQNPYGKRTWGHHHNQLKDKSAPRFDEKYKFRISSIYTKFRNMGPCWTPCQ